MIKRMKTVHKLPTNVQFTFIQNPTVKPKLVVKKVITTSSLKSNKKYKDTIFTKLFQNKEAAIELYNALYHENLPKNTPIEMITLDAALFTKRKNDVAFIIKSHCLIFTEHQSTLNENMPLRLLLYTAEEYEKLIGYTMVKGKVTSNPLLYKKKQIKIPKPDFFVLYNGNDNLTEKVLDKKTGKAHYKQVTEKTLKLSDAFLENSPSENTLELLVKIIDIRYSSAHQSLYIDKDSEKLSILGEYSYFNHKAKELTNHGNSLKTAIKIAARHCINKGILKEFLLKNETEVVKMFLGIYDEELEKQVAREEAREEGWEEGRVEGRIEGRIEGINVLIETLLDFNYSSDKILQDLQKKFTLTPQQANDYLQQYYERSR